jgi:hypothetical protein
MKNGFRERYPRFKKGDWVKLTREAVRANIKGYGSLYGIVTRTPERTRVGRMSVSVRRLDQKRQAAYWAGFWRPIHWPHEARLVSWAQNQQKGTQRRLA